MRLRRLAVLSSVVFGLAIAQGCECGRIRSVEDGKADPVAATKNVSGGVSATSPNFRLITTTAPSSGAAQSKSFKLRSGVVAGTQSTTEGTQP